MKKSKPEKKSLQKQKHDRRRTEWRKKHRTLGGRIILYPDKQPEHVNARASKTYNWFWHQILLEMQPQDIPGIISSLKHHIKTEEDLKQVRVFRTMIGMAEDAFQLKRLENIHEVDSELLLGPTPVFDSEEGVVYRKGQLFTTDYNEDETSILVRDTEGTLIDTLFSSNRDAQEQSSTTTLMHQSH